MRTSSEKSDIEYELCCRVSNKQPTPHSIADILGIGFRISYQPEDEDISNPLLLGCVRNSEMADCVTERDIDMMANDEPLDLSVHKSRCRSSEDEHGSDSPKLKRRTIADSHPPYQPPQLNGQSEQSLQMAANFSTVLQYYLTAARLWQSEVIQCNESRSASSVEMTASDENALTAEATRPESSGPPPASKSNKRRKKELDSAVTDGASRPRKTRTTFTGKQLFELEKIFEQKKYLSSNERQEVARLLNVTGSQIKIWFQNRRTKWKKQDPATSAAELAHLKSASRATKSGKPVLDRSQQDAAAISASENSDAATNVSTPPASPSPE